MCVCQKLNKFWTLKHTLILEIAPHRGLSFSVIKQKLVKLSIFFSVEIFSNLGPESFGSPFRSSGRDFNIDFESQARVIAIFNKNSTSKIVIRLVISTELTIIPSIIPSMAPSDALAKVMSTTSTSVIHSNSIFNTISDISETTAACLVSKYSHGVTYKVCTDLSGTIGLVIVGIGASNEHTKG